VRITLINQAFYPDVVSSGQHLTDLARHLAEQGHQVTVVTSRRAYDDPSQTFPKHEHWNGITIYRVFNTGFGKRNKVTRALDFASFILSCCFRLCFLPKPNVIVAMTSPPLISVLAACFARVRGSKFIYWVMDLNPDEALAAGWLAPGSFAAKWLERLSRFSIKSAAKIIVLDRFMQKRISDKGVTADKIEVIAPWSHDSEVNFDPQGRSEFRRTHGLEGKFVVMYSGNHSPCHPLDTILGAAKRLAGDSDFAFCFVGGGTEFARVKRFAQKERPNNIVCVPYQPLNALSAGLSAADLHLVVMGNPFVGLVHPCKIYNILRVGSPMLYIGPTPSHVSELLQKLNHSLPFASIRHGDVDGVYKTIVELKKGSLAVLRSPRCALPAQFAKDSLLPRLVEVLERSIDNQPHAFATPVPKLPVQVRSP
jgi:glycosyltransferase involved in cell wall biosynthesis